MSGETVEIKVPTLGESVTEATVAQWFKQQGDAVKTDELIAELETDKVTVEVFAPVDGVLSEIIAKTDENVEVGALLAKLKAGAKAEDKAEQTTTPSEKAVRMPDHNDTEEKVSSADTNTQKEQKENGPAVRRLVAENNIATDGLSGTGKDGRLTKGDVLNAPSENKQAKPQTKTVSVAPEQEERVKMSRLRLRIAERLKEAQDTAAMLTTFNEIDMSAVMSLRSQYKDEFQKRHNIKLGFMGFFTQAVIKALQDVPAVNAEIDGNELVYKRYYHIGMAVGTDAGLVVPVVKNADTLGLAGIENSIANLAGKARDGKLSMDDMQGGTFTITNGGVYGSLLSTPILNIPQSGILGLHKIEKRPIVVSGKSGDEIAIRPMMYVALSYDHRIIDGKEAVTFLVKVKEAMEDPQRLLLNI